MKKRQRKKNEKKKERNYKRLVDQFMRATAIDFQIPLSILRGDFSKFRSKPMPIIILDEVDELEFIPPCPTFKRSKRFDRFIENTRSNLSDSLNTPIEEIEAKYEEKTT